MRRNTKPTNAKVRDSISQPLSKANIREGALRVYMSLERLHKKWETVIAIGKAWMKIRPDPTWRSSMKV